jgi:GT2 family glycosyltransferase
MVTKTFLHGKYARDNGDVAQQYGAEDEFLLRSHYESYGRAELRGIDVAEHMRIDGVVCCNTGHILLTGWADRRHLDKLKLTIDVGYERHEFEEVEPAWYWRPDVATAIGDMEHPPGFLMLVELYDVTQHPSVTITVNSAVVFRSANMRWQAVPQFLNQALGAVAVAADLPIGQSLAIAETLHPAFADVWNAFLARLSFVKIFENAQGGSPQQSIIITLYKRASMLIPQLEALAPLIAGTSAEIVIVGNDLLDAEQLAERLRGFCQIWNLPLRLYLCSGNSGFSAANNFGAEVARGRTLVFMNPDVFPPEDTALAADAQRFLFSDPGDELVGALLYYGEGALMHAGMYAVGDSTFDLHRASAARALRVEHFGKGLSHRIHDGQAALDAALTGLRQDVMLMSAALWKIDRTLFLEAGGLSTDYIFAYYEDADFCLQLLARGTPMRLDRTARWIHLEGASKAFSPPQRAYMWLNRCLFTSRFLQSPHVVDSHDDLELL